MSQIHDLNPIINNRAYNVYVLDSHCELTLIVESMFGLEYAEILGVMVTHNSKTKIVENIVSQAKDYITESLGNNQ